MARGELVNSNSRRLAARESDVSNVGMRHERRTHLFSEARDDIHYAIRESGSPKQIGELDDGAGCELRRLDDCRAPGRQRWRELPASQCQRRVPGRDDSHHALRLVTNESELSWLVVRHDVA